MKSTIQRALIAVAVVTLGAGAAAAASAQTTTTPAPASSAPQQFHRSHFHHFDRSPFLGSLLHAAHQMGLTPAEQSSIKSILASARSAHPPGTVPAGPAITVIGNPSDPGYAAAVQNAQTNASARIQKESVLAGQIYAALSPEHQKALPGVLASIQAKQEARRAAWATKHATGNG